MTHIADANCFANVALLPWQEWSDQSEGPFAVATIFFIVWMSLADDPTGHANWRW